MNRPKICWVTADYFFDVDVPVIPLVNKKFDLQWIVVNSRNNAAAHKMVLDKVINKGVNALKICNLKHRLSNVMIIIEYLKIINCIKKNCPDIIYLDITSFPYFLPLVFLMINRKKIVYAAHNVSTPKGAFNARIVGKIQRIILTVAYNIHVFSDNQKQILENDYKNKNVLKTPLALKDFGECDEKPSETEIVFLFFGYIREYKRLDLLINAAEAIVSQTSIKFKIRIAGSCDFWDKYAKIITRPELFDLSIRNINDEEIPRIFKSSHYLVMPYQDSTQSGVLSVAYNYNIPCIASKINSFEEHIENGKTGFLFENCSLNSLQNVMLETIENHTLNYQNLKKELNVYVQENFSIKSIVDKYINYLEKIYHDQNR